MVEFLCYQVRQVKSAGMHSSDCFTVIQVAAGIAAIFGGRFHEIRDSNRTVRVSHSRCRSWARSVIGGCPSLGPTTLTKPASKLVQVKTTVKVRLVGGPFLVKFFRPRPRSRKYSEA